MFEAEPYLEQERRKNDILKERQMTKLYDEIYNFANIKTSRIDDIENQLKGIDIEFLVDNQCLTVDEKCAVKQYNYSLQTFGFELWRRKKQGKGGIPGWFHDDSNVVTQYYSLGYVRADTYQDVGTNPWRFEVVIVSKEKIKNLLKEYNIYNSKDILQQFSNASRNNELHINEKGRFMWITPEIKVNQNTQYSEKAISILIPKKLLVQIADFHAVKYNKQIKIFKNLISKPKTKIA